MPTTIRFSWRAAMTRRGFTAPELAVVFVIMAAASLLVVRGNVVARHRARDASCMSNLKQLALALQLYAADNDYRFPPEPKAWRPIAPYARDNLGVFECPYAGRDRRSGDQISDYPSPDSGERRETVRSDYLLNSTVQTDDLPTVIIAGDDVPDRHPGGRWIGVRLDGAATRYPAQQWAQKLGKVTKDVKEAK